MKAIVRNSNTRVFYLRTPLGDIVVDFDTLVPGDVFRMEDDWDASLPIYPSYYYRVLSRTEGGVLVEPFFHDKFTRTQPI